jgi:SAM-dependent methyltransferase
MSKTLDLGCGEKIANPYMADECFGIDIIVPTNKNIKQADLAVEPIPFGDNSFEYITAYDFVEHIPRLLYINGERLHPFINLMNEIHRVLKPGGIFRAHTPAIPYPQAFQDPTHVNFITEETVQYFAGYYKDVNRYYGYTGDFSMMSQHWDSRLAFHLVWELKAEK